MRSPLSLFATVPRDTRDTLFLLLVIAWIIAPQTLHLPLWCSALAIAVLLWRGWIAVRGQPLPGRSWVFGLLLVTTLSTYWTYHQLMGREPGVTFIVVLLVLKTLELRAQRDAFVVFFLGFFVLLTNFLYSQSLPIAASMLMGLLGLLTALVNSHRPVGHPSLASSARTAGTMTLMGAPIMVVLFVLFPRVAPLWGMPSDSMGGRSGLSPTMQVGTITNLALDSSVAMRVLFDGPVPAQRELYFRGPVLNRFDGQEWYPAAPRRSTVQGSASVQSPGSAQSIANLRTQGNPVRYQVTQEANRQPWLLVLDASAEAPKLDNYTPRMSADLQWTVERSIAELVRFSATSYTTFSHGPDIADPSLQAYLQLPAGYNPRTLQWAQTLRADPRLSGAQPSDLINEVLNQLRTGGYRYTLDPGVFGTHSADEFWFDRKAGFCEHIASSFVIVLRALQIPSRVVTGYQGGERNAIDDYWTVRQSDAHAWAEVWLAGKGWVRVDPTSAVAPARTGSLQRLVPPQNPLAQALGTVISPRFALNLRAGWEALNNQWNQWVLNYSQSRQMDLLRSLGFQSPSWADLSYVLIAIVVIASASGALWTLLERRQQDPWLSLLHRARARLARSGITLPSNTPPQGMSHAVKVATALSDPDRSALHDWLLRMEHWRYGPAHGNAAQRRRMLGTLRREFALLPWPRP
jgi:transglutaminase-like putative cysteine protease